MKAQKFSRKLIFIVSFLLFMIALSRPAQALYDVNNTGVSDVYGLSGTDVQPAIGSDFGTVRAIADTNNAYALYGSGDDIEISGSFPSGGMIYAEAGTDYAYGLYNDSNGLITTGDLDGTISVVTGNNFAYGLLSNNLIPIARICGAGEIDDYNYSSLITGDINGSIFATAGNYYACGLSSNNSLTTGDINGTIKADAYLGACGLRSYDYSLTIGMINGDITAIADTDSASGLAAYTSITTGDINGTITTTAGNAYAIGLSTFSGAITTGAINGSIIVEAGDYTAYGLNSSNGSIITGNINGDITVSTGTSDASGLECGNTLTTGDINGTIDVTAGANGALGLKSSNGPVTIGDIDGEINVHAGTYGAYGILSNGSQIIIGDIDGTVTVTSGANSAFGLCSYSDSGSLTTGEIRGTISANAGGDYAYGILSYGPMDIKINGGSVIATVDTGMNASAIQSGNNIYETPLKTQNADDRVEIVAGSTIIGDIDLAMYGTDNDILTLSGVDSNSTTFNDDLKNIETINLTGGTWYINGDVYNGLNGINMTGGVLGGTGTLGSLNVTDGTLAPGNSIGTTTINGDLTLGSDSTLEVEIDNSGNSDKLVVSGDASINGGTLKAISTETITDSQEYTIIEAQSVSGKFNTIDTALLSTTISNPFTVTENTSNKLLLKIFPMQFDSSEIVASEEQASLGTALQVIADGGGNSITTALQQLTNLSDVRNTYDQLSGQTAATLASVASTGSTRFTDTVSGRLNNTHSGVSSSFNDSTFFAMSQPDRNTSMYDTDRSMNSIALGNGTNYYADEDWGFWLRGYGVFGERETQSDSPGYQYRIYGTGFGVDYKFSDEFVLGLTGGYSDGHINYSSSQDESDITSTPIGLYGSWFDETGYIDSVVSYTPMEYETERFVSLTSEKLKGSFGGSETSVYLETGRNWFYDEDSLIQPMASFQFSYLDLDKYTETGGVSALSFDDHNYKSYKGALGMKAKKQFWNEARDESFAIELRGRWLHEFGDTKSNINANFVSNPSAIFKVSDKGLPRDSAVFGIGLRQMKKENVMYYIDYDTSINAEDTAHIISAGLRYRW